MPGDAHTNLSSHRAGNARIGRTDYRRTLLRCFLGLACRAHVTPEAAVGGTIALVKNGDLITLDADKGLIQLGVTGAEIKRRRASWKPRKPRYKDGVLAEYAAHVSSASEGAVLI
jgi:dihydroxyacid dehydratase/phosphogluconate dehydratase